MKINMYYRPVYRTDTGTFNNKPLYHGFPRTTSGKQDSAVSWATQNNGDCWLVECDNKFTECHILDEKSIRGWNYSTGVMQVVLYIDSIDAYIKLDMRLDGLIDVLVNHSIIKGKFSCNVGINFKSANYYVVSYDNVEIVVPSAKNKTSKIKPVVGQMYELSYSRSPSMYLGEFICKPGTIDLCGVDISNRKCYVFMYYFKPYNSTTREPALETFMKIPKIVESKIPSDFFLPQSDIVTKYGTLKQYGCSIGKSFKIDIADNTFEIV